MVSVSPPKLMAYGISASNDSPQHFKKAKMAQGTAWPVWDVHIHVTILTILWSLAHDIFNVRCYLLISKVNMHSATRLQCCVGLVQFSQVGPHQWSMLLSSSDPVPDTQVDSCFRLIRTSPEGTIRDDQIVYIHIFMRVIFVIILATEHRTAIFSTRESWMWNILILVMRKCSPTARVWSEILFPRKYNVRTYTVNTLQGLTMFDKHHPIRPDYNHPAYVPFTTYLLALHGPGASGHHVQMVGLAVLTVHESASVGMYTLAGLWLCPPSHLMPSQPLRGPCRDETNFTNCYFGQSQYAECDVRYMNTTDAEKCQHFP